MVLEPYDTYWLGDCHDPAKLKDALDAFIKADSALATNKASSFDAESTNISTKNLTPAGTTST